jgi:hypothetical protein
MEFLRVYYYQGKESRNVTPSIQEAWTRYRDSGKPTGRIPENEVAYKKP